MSSFRKIGSAHFKWNFLRDCCRVSCRADVQWMLRFLSSHLWGLVASHSVCRRTLQARVHMPSRTGQIADFLFEWQVYKLLLRFGLESPRPCSFRCCMMAPVCPMLSARVRRCPCPLITETSLWKRRRDPCSHLEQQFSAFATHGDIRFYYFI